MTISKLALESIKQFLTDSYEFDITSLRCPKSGSLTYVISDSELETLYRLADNNLEALAESLETLHSYASPAITWRLVKDDSLDILRYEQPREFFNYAIRELADINSYYSRYRDRRNGEFSPTGKFQIQADFSRFAEQAEAYWASEQGQQALAELPSLNEKLLLLLSIGGTSRIEKLIANELSFDWVIAELTSGNLLPRLTKFLNQIINEYKLKHGIGFDSRLTIADINRISQQARQQALAESKAKAEWRAKLIAQKASYHQKVKTSRSRTNDYAKLADNIIAELELVNTDRNDYINQATMKRASLMFNDKDTTAITRLAKQAISSANKARAASQPEGYSPIKTITFSLTNIVIRTKEENNDQ